MHRCYHLPAVLMTGLILQTVLLPAQTLSPPVRYSGMCNASAAVALDDDHFVVADDEDSRLRIYRTDDPGSPPRIVDVSAFLELDRKSPETDIEGAARIGSRIYWITSHGRNQNGKRRESRERFFATFIQPGSQGLTLVPMGRPYKALLQDLVNDPALRPFNLAAASQRAPKEKGALNIEGLCATPNGTLLVGLRNPVAAKGALLIPLLNPGEVISGSQPHLGPPILIDLGGLGIREIVQHDGRYLIVAGAHDGRGQSLLYQWAGGDAPPIVYPSDRLKGFNAEAIVIHPSRGWREIQLLSDDGKLRSGDKLCKNQEDPNLKTFRSVWMRPAAE